MFSKIIITFVILFQYNIEGYPSESNLVAHDVKHYVSPRIVGGQDAPIGYAKHMTALVTGSNVKMLSCGGSIVSDRIVLSAAHCLEIYGIHGEFLPYLKGVIGSNYWNSTNMIKFIRYRNHPEYNSWTLKNDIGYLVTDAKIKFGVLVQPIALESNHVGGGAESFVVGFGRVGLFEDVPCRLKLLYLQTIASVQCVLQMKIAARLLGWSPPFVNPKLEICTYHSKGHGMCHGDSGSGLVDFKTKKQIGIVSWGLPCAIGGPDVYVRISAYTDFLNKALEEHVES